MDHVLLEQLSLQPSRTYNVSIRAVNEASVVSGVARSSIKISSDAPLLTGKNLINVDSSPEIFSHPVREDCEI